MNWITIAAISIRRMRRDDDDGDLGPREMH